MDSVRYRIDPNLETSPRGTERALPAAPTSHSVSDCDSHNSSLTPTRPAAGVICTFLAAADMLTMATPRFIGGCNSTINGVLHVRMSRVSRRLQYALLHNIGLL
jgi:hypothetical protein